MTTLGTKAPSLGTEPAPEFNLLDLIEAAEVPWISVEAFGADPAASDNTAAIQAAIDAAGVEASGQSPAENAGATLLFPGFYRCTGTINADNTKHLTFLGVGSQAGGYSRRGPSGLSYTATGDDDFISARASSGFNIRNMTVQYTRDEYTGNLINLNGLSADTGFAFFENCLIGGAWYEDLPVDQVLNSATLVSLSSAILCTFQNCEFQFGAVGADGSNSSYSNAIRFVGCSFSNLRTCLLNPNEQWTVIDPHVEAGNSGESGTANASGIQRFLRVETNRGGSAQVIGGWFGDVSSEHIAWYDIASGSAAFTLQVIGGAYSGQFMFVSGAQINLHVLGCSVSTGPLDGIVVDMSGGALSGIVSYAYTGTGDPVGWASVPNVDRLTVMGVGGGHTAEGIDRMVLLSHMQLTDVWTTSPTVAAGASGVLGTGGSPGAALNDTATDGAGRISVTTGSSGTGPGVLATVTAVHPYNATYIPRVQLQPLNADTAALDVYITNQGASGWAVATGATPTASKTYSWDYFVIQ